MFVLLINAEYRGLKWSVTDEGGKIDEKDVKDSLTDTTDSVEADLTEEWVL